MKNKSEPLRGKIDQIGYTPAFTIKDVTSAVKFYRKYRVPIDFIKDGYMDVNMYSLLLWDDHQEIVKLYLDKGDDQPYNEWLYDYCFDDVIE